MNATKATTKIASVPNWLKVIAEVAEAKAGQLQAQAGQQATEAGR